MEIIPGGPSLMSVAKVGLSIAGGPWASFALDSFVTGAMVACGKMSLEDGFMSTMKGIAGNIAGELAGSITGELGKVLKDIGVGDVVTSVSTSMVNTAMMHYANSAIQAAEIGPGGIRINKDKFKKASSGLGGALLKSGVSSLVIGAIHKANGAEYGKYKAANGTEKFGWNNSIGGALNKNNTQMLSVGNTIGSLVSESISLAQGDGFSFNILNSADLLGGNHNHQGLLKLTLGGKNSGFSFGGGGMDVSASAIKNFAAGMREFDFRDRMLSSSNYKSDTERNMVLGKVNMLRWSGNKNALAIAESIVDGKTGVQFGNSDMAINDI